MRHFTKYGMLMLAISAAFAVQAMDDERRGGDAKPPKTNKIPKPVTLPIPGPPPSAQPPSGSIQQPPEFLRGPKVDLTVAVRGDGIVRWGTEICGTADGELEKTCQSKAKKDALVSFVVEPRPGNKFVGWEGACKKEGYKNTAYFCTVKASEALTVNAGFAAKPESKTSVEVTVKITNAGGSVKTSTFATGDMDCTHPLSSTKYGNTAGKTSGNCTILVEKGTTVSLTPFPEKAAIFNFWKSDFPGCSQTSGTECSFVADKDSNVTAIFSRKSTSGTGSGSGQKPNPSESIPQAPVYTVTVMTGSKNGDMSWANSPDVKEMFVCTTPPHGNYCVAKVAKKKIRIFGLWKSKTTNKQTRWANKNEWGNCPSPHDQYCDVEVTGNITLSLK